MPFFSAREEMDSLQCIVVYVSAMNKHLTKHDEKHAGVDTNGCKSSGHAFEGIHAGPFQEHTVPLLSQELSKVCDASIWECETILYTAHSCQTLDSSC